MNINTDISLLKIKYAQTTKKPSMTNAMDKNDPKRYNAELKKASDGFEELFVHQLLKEMRKSIPKTGLLDGGRGEEIFQDMLDENYAKVITESGGLGLSDVIYEANKKNEAPAQVNQETGRKNK